MAEQYDAVIVGGGPAGTSCAIWLARLGLTPLLLEAAPQLGGLVRHNPFVDNWLAVLPGLTGREMAENMTHSVASAGVVTRLDARVRHIERCASGWSVQTAGEARDERIRARHVVIASGTTARPLPGQSADAHFAGVLVGPGVHVAEQDYRGKSVAVLGGGDNAFENYSFVRSAGAAEVHIYARSIRAQNQWVERARIADVHFGPYAVEPAARRVNGRQYDLILVFYGWEPRATFVDHLPIARHSAGYLTTDARTAETSVPGIYAIGEVAHRMHPCVATALADGVVAAKAIQARCQVQVQTPFG